MGLESLEAALQRAQPAHHTADPVLNIEPRWRAAGRKLLKLVVMERVLYVGVDQRVQITERLTLARRFNHKVERQAYAEVASMRHFSNVSSKLDRPWGLCHW